MPLTTQTLPSVPNLYRTFEESNIEHFEWDNYLRVLDAMFDEWSLAPDDVLAVSQAWGLVTIFRPGLGTGRLRGFINKSPELSGFVRYAECEEVKHEADGRWGRKIILLDERGKTLREMRWGTGGPVRPEHAAAESDRIMLALRRVMLGE